MAISDAAQGASQTRVGLHHYLLCTPDCYHIEAEINPWMSRSAQPSGPRARREWQNLIDHIVAAGARVDVMDCVPGNPDMVFAADSGFVLNGRFVKGAFRHRSRQGEVRHTEAWFAARGCPVVDLGLPPDVYLEGGDFKVFGDVLVAGHGVRTDRAAHDLLADRLGVAPRSIRLVDERYYHLDTTFCPLDRECALVLPSAWDRAGRLAIADLVSAPIELTPEEAALLCANAMVVGRTVIMHACPPRLARCLAARDFELRIAPVDEFVKSGAAMSCMTMALHQRVSAARQEGR